MMSGNRMSTFHRDNFLSEENRMFCKCIATYPQHSHDGDPEPDVVARPRAAVAARRPAVHGARHRLRLRTLRGMPRRAGSLLVRSSVMYQTTLSYISVTTDKRGSGLGDVDFPLGTPPCHTFQLLGKFCQLSTCPSSNIQSTATVDWHSG